MTRLAQALIPPAGCGLRAYPKTENVPKVLLKVDGEPLLMRNLAILRDALGIRDVTVIVGHLGDQVCALLGTAASSACASNTSSTARSSAGWLRRVARSRPRQRAVRRRAR